MKHHLLWSQAQSEARAARGLTFIEMVVSLAVAMMAFSLVYSFLSGTRSHYMYGTVNLENLQNARLALNYLRRDFSSACPLFVKPSGNTFSDQQKAFKNVTRLRDQIFSSASNPELGQPIQIQPDQVLFYRYDFQAGDQNPVVQMVRYEFDAAARKLRRLVAGGRTIEFEGFEQVSFKLYCHELNPRIPLLSVRLVIHEGKNIFGTGNIGQALDVHTTISSSFLNSSEKDRRWNYEVYQKQH